MEYLFIVFLSGSIFMYFFIITYQYSFGLLNLSVCPIKQAENPHAPDWNEQNEDVRMAWEAENISAQRYDELFGYMQSHVEKSQVCFDMIKSFCIHVVHNAYCAWATEFEGYRSGSFIKTKLY